ncbi:4Fe-4S dicluster domain-containing protein, partial [bacterium]|nr:4Fe-4S dicluster domain-containing protein [bacterium]
RPLLGVASFLSPFKIRRDKSGCTDCRQCSRACPSGLSVHAKETVRSAECTGCLTCVASCPQREVLRMAPRFWTRSLPAWAFPALAVLLFAAGIGIGMATGHWHSSLTYDDYRQLIPMVPSLSH